VIGIGIALMAIGIADLVAGGLAGEPRGVGRAVAALCTAGVIVAVGGGIAGFGLASTLGLLALVVLGDGAWIVLRLRTPPTHGNAWWALAALGSALGATLGMSFLWTGTYLPEIAAWFDSLPVPFLARLDFGQGTALIGVLVFQLATVNGIVRAVLAAAGTPAHRSELRLRGGRLIGPIERLLIFGLAIAGQPTAATLIVSAKSILRFPELSRQVGVGPSTTAATEVDFVTEYFLLGSLVSWLAALAPAILFSA